MIKHIKIRNFRSYKEADLNLSPFVNVIIGLPQSGKSTIIRGLELITSNRPLGTGFMPKDTKKKVESLIEVTDDSNTIGLKKVGKVTKKGVKKVESTSFYHSDIKDDFNNVDKDVPDVIKEALNINSINLQKQNDEHFLITSSPGEIAKTINKITKLEKTDEWVSELTSRINKKKNQVVVLKEDANVLDLQLEKFKTLDELEENIIEYEELKSEISTLKGKRNKLDSLIITLRQLKSSIDSKSELIKNTDALLKKVDKVDKEKTELENKKEKYDTIIKTIKSLKPKLNKDRKIIKVMESDYKKVIKIIKEREEIETKLDAIEKAFNLEEKLSIDIKEMFNTYEECLKINKEIEETKAKLKVINRALECEEKLETTEKKKEKLEAEFVKLLGNKCPTCFQKLNNKQIKEIIG